jgi:hypothetical protein
MPEPSSRSYQDRDKWNQLLFDQANKFHIHQDNLRWSLTAGFGAFFAAGVTLITKQQLSDPIARALELLLAIIGTLWFFVVQIEGWYYNLAIAYLISCEEAVSKKEDLIPLVRFDRSAVRSFHPSFFFVLLFISVTNSYHVFQYTLSSSGSTLSARSLAAGYFCVMLFLMLRGRVPQKLDATIGDTAVPRRIRRKRV